jgi:molybdopterin-biosynthesis enzyme MoeA-like protein
MQAEVVVVGSELLLRLIIDTDPAVIARHLAGIGLNLFHKTTAGDNLGRVAATLRQALDRSQVVLSTGGIGPTARRPGLDDPGGDAHARPDPSVASAAPLTTTILSSVTPPFVVQSSR